MIKVEHKKGKHNVGILDKIRIYFISLFRKKLIIKFTEDSKYDLKDEDQYDFNKIVGRGGLIVNSKGIRKTEQFLVWRYNIKEDVFEVTQYWRKDYKFDYNRDLIKMRVNQEEEFDLSFLKSPIPSGGHFGGNEVAPNDLNYKIKGVF